MISMIRLIIFLTLYIETTLSWNLNFNSHRGDSYDGYQKKNVLPTDVREEYDDIPYSRSSNANAIPSSSSSSHTKTRYFYKTHQSATVSLPSQHQQRGNRVNVGPDEDETRSYLTKIDSTNVGSPRRHARRPREQDDDDYQGGMEPKPFFRTGKLCIKCPPEKILIAKRGLDGVHVDIPQLTTCNDRPISRSVYELETLFSKKHHFILPRGSHSFIGQIVNKKNFSVEHVCSLKYKIIVRSCGPFIPQNMNVKVKCDAADLWGSKCSFSCKNNNGILTHKEQVFCNDNLQWHGEEPDCINAQHRDYFKRIEGAISSCQLPTPPEHAKFSCKVDRDLINEHENELFIPDGTICRIKCARFFEISENLQRYSSFVCKIGRFNYTHHDNFCTKIQLKKFA